MDIDFQSVVAAAVGLGGAIGAYVKSRFDYKQQEKRYNELKIDADTCHKNNSELERKLIDIEASNVKQRVEISELTALVKALNNLIIRKN